MSWRDSITVEEKDAIEELKKLTIQDCTPKMLEDDALFYRFMKARDFNLKNAEDMLNNHFNWRKEYQIETIMKDYKPNEVMAKYVSVTFLGYDKDGDVVKYFDMGRIDVKGVLNIVKKIDIIKHNLQVNERDLERMRQHSKELGIQARKLCFILNFDELTFAKATNKKALELLVLAAKMYQDNYPEIIKNMILINASVYFTLLYSIVKVFIAPTLQEKIRVFGSEGYKEALLELMDADVLPAFLGGSRTDPDGNPNCNTFVKWAEVIPEKCYMRKSEKRLSASPGVKKLTVTRFSKSDIRFEVKEPDSLLEWEFETKSRDIGFGVYFKDSSCSAQEGDSKPIELVPKQRIDTCMEPGAGVYKCNKSGTYIMVFDNSYSWIYPKEIFYRARIIGPDDKENSPWT